jgi:hypothetical protein
MLEQAATPVAIAKMISLRIVRFILQVLVEVLISAAEYL